MFNHHLPRRTLLQGLAHAALLAASPRALGAVARGESVPWPEVGLLDGGRFGPAQAQGRAVVAVFWSVSCPFCRRHNEHVQQLHRAAQGKPLTVLGIARDRDEAAVRRHVAERGYGFAVTTEHARLASVLAPRNVIPLTVAVDRRGRLVQAYPGEMFEADVMELLALADGRA